MAIATTELTTEEQAISNKAILDANNTEKQHKDVMLMNIKELDNHSKYLQARINEMDMEYRSRRKLVDGINAGIAGAQAELSMVRENVQKEKASLIADMEKKLNEVIQADKILRGLQAENEAILVSNKQRESALIEEKRICNAQVFEMKKALDQNQSEWTKREADILKREAELKESTAKFEAERDALIPEMARITSIKNENTNLLQEIERQRNLNTNITAGLESEKQIFEETKLAEKAKLTAQFDKIANEEKRLREWEQGLKDVKLEMDAKIAKADKTIRQFQHHKEIENSK
jgi:hypothetical protein